jgi:hypothetical protein
MFPLQIITYVKIFAGVILLSGCFYGYIEHNRFQAYKEKIQSIAKEQEAKNESIRTQQELINKTTKETYEAKLSAIKSYYGGMHNSSSGQMPSISNPSTGANGSPSDQLLACAYTTQQLVSLQDWIKEQVALR